MSTRKKNTYATYAHLHDSLMRLDEPAVCAALRAELSRSDQPPRVDYIRRLIGRYNRLRGNRVMSALLSSLAIPHAKRAGFVDSVLNGRPEKKKKATPAHASPANNG